MKRYNFIITLLFTILLMSCDGFLEEDPPNYVALSSFLEDEEEVRQVCDACYYYLHDGGWTSLYSRFWPAIDLGTDDVTSRPASSTFNSLFDYSITGSHTWLESWGAWGTFWKGIYHTNLLLDHLPDVAMVDSVSSTYEGEARALRALYYYHLVRTYGDVPIITWEIETFDDFSGLSRQSVDSVYNQVIIPDLIYAAEHCEDALHLGRMTKWSAKVILADVYMTRAGWRRTSQGEFVQGDSKYWTMARDVAADIIMNSPHELVTEDYVNESHTTPACGVPWLIDQPYSKESMFEMSSMYEKLQGSFLPRESYPNKTGSNFWGQNTDVPFADDGSVNEDKTVAEMTFEGDVAGTGTYIPTPDIYRAFEDGDKRKEWSILTQYDDAEGNRFLIWPCIRKYVDINYYLGQDGTNMENIGNNFVLYRYADALLIYAEAANEVGSEADGMTMSKDSCLNAIRSRAGLSSLSGLSYDEFQTAVWLERRCEFFGECKRRFDLIRTLRFAEVVRKVQSEGGTYIWQASDNPGHFYGDEGSDYYGYGKPLATYLPNKAWLLPIPTFELEINTTWENNEGY